MSQRAKDDVVGQSERADPFQAIIDEAVRRAERVDCDIATFREGLRTMMIAVKERLDLEAG